jgi:hypothetical protein
MPTVSRSGLQSCDVEAGGLQSWYCFSYFQLVVAETGSTNTKSGGGLLNQY